MNQERRNQIIEWINQKHTIKNSELIERFGISVETVRRDLEYLERQGHLQRVYGGAVLKTSLGSEPEYASRFQEHLAEKNAIAEAAARLIAAEDSVFLGVGTTVQAIAKYLSHELSMAVFTNSLHTAIALSDIAGCSIVLPGGQLRAKELSLSGFPAEENLSCFNVNKAFIGIGGITDAGITDFHIGEARLHRQIIHNASQTIVLADSSKFGIRGTTNVCTLQDIDILITDSKAPADYIRLIEQAGVQVMLAGKTES